MRFIFLLCSCSAWGFDLLNHTPESLEVLLEWEGVSAPHMCMTIGPYQRFSPGEMLLSSIAFTSTQPIRLFPLQPARAYIEGRYYALSSTESYMWEGEGRFGPYHVYYGNHGEVKYLFDK